MKKLIIEASFDGEKLNCGEIAPGHIFKLNETVFIVAEISTQDEVAAVNLFNGAVESFANEVVVELPTCSYRTFVNYL